MNPQQTTPQQPSNFMTALPIVLGVVSFVLASIGASSQQLADAGLSVPTGLLALCSTVGAALTSYRNQMTAAKAPADPPPVSKDGQPVSELDHTISLAVQQALVNKDTELAARLVAAINPPKAGNAQSEVKS